MRGFAQQALCLNWEATVRETNGERACAFYNPPARLRA
jgi:hypothetical protein